MPVSSAFKTTVALIALLTAFFAGWLESERYHEPATIAVTPHPPRRQPDGSLIAARSATPQPPRQAIPKGDRVLDTARIQLSATPTLAAGIALAPASAGPVFDQPVTPQLVQQCRRILRCVVSADESLLATPDGQQDLAISTPDGHVDTATLAPAAPALVPKMHPWALGLSYGSGGPGLTAARQFQDVPVSLGVDVYRDERAGLEGRVELGWRF